MSEAVMGRAERVPSFSGSLGINKSLPPLGLCSVPTRPHNTSSQSQLTSVLLSTRSLMLARL